MGSFGCARSAVLAAEGARNRVVLHADACTPPAIRLCNACFSTCGRSDLLADTVLSWACSLFVVEIAFGCTGPGTGREPAPVRHTPTRIATCTIAAGIACGAAAAAAADAARNRLILVRSEGDRDTGSAGSSATRGRSGNPTHADAYRRLWHTHQSTRKWGNANPAQPLCVRTVRALCAVI